MLYQFVLLPYFNCLQLPYSDKVTNLGHVLISTLDDTPDTRTVRDMNRKVNSFVCISKPFSIW